MDRKEAYALIKEHNLEQEVKDQFGKNFTQVSTANLENLISEYLDEIEDDEYDDDYDKEDSASSEESVDTNTVDNPYEAACMAFVGVLKDMGLLEAVLKRLN